MKDKTKETILKGIAYVSGALLAVLILIMILSFVFEGIAMAIIETLFP